MVDIVGNTMVAIVIGGVGGGGPPAGLAAAGGVATPGRLFKFAPALGTKMSGGPEAGSDGALMSAEEAVDVPELTADPEDGDSPEPEERSPAPAQPQLQVQQPAQQSARARTPPAPRTAARPPMKPAAKGISRPDMKASSSDLRGGSALSDLDDTDSELSEGENFLTKGAFLLTPSNELNMEKASNICEKMNFRGPYSLTKTATGILFKFAEIDDYQATFKKGFHKVTGARFYKKIPIPCRPQKTFVVFVLEVPEEVPEEDIRHALYKFSSVVEVCRLQGGGGGGVVTSASGTSLSSAGGQQTSGSTRALDKVSRGESASTSGNTSGGSEGNPSLAGLPPPLVRVTLSNLDECNLLIQNGLDFYGATFFPTEPATSNIFRTYGGRKSGSGNSEPPFSSYWYPYNRRYSRLLDPSSGGRVRDLLPVFDNTAFSKIPPPASKIVKPK